MVYVLFADTVKNLESICFKTVFTLGTFGRALQCGQATNTCDLPSGCQETPYKLGGKTYIEHLRRRGEGCAPLSFLFVGRCGMKEMQESLSAKNPHQCISSRRSRKRLACGQRRERSISPIYYCACDLRPREVERVGLLSSFTHLYMLVQCLPRLPSF